MTKYNIMTKRKTQTINQNMEVFYNRKLLIVWCGPIVYSCNQCARHKPENMTTWNMTTWNMTTGKIRQFKRLFRDFLKIIMRCHLALLCTHYYTNGCLTVWIQLVITSNEKTILQYNQKFRIQMCYPLRLNQINKILCKYNKSVQYILQCIIDMKLPENFWNSHFNNTLKEQI